MLRRVFRRWNTTCSNGIDIVISDYTSLTDMVRKIDNEPVLIEKLSLWIVFITKSGKMAGS